MGDLADRRSMITRLCLRLAEVLSRTLQPDEREAVLGDLAERGETGVQALSDVLALVVRRQAVLWIDWRPWATLVVVIAPLAMMLSLRSGLVANGSAAYTWLYINNWDWALLKNAGFWFVLSESAKSVLADYLTLVCWSWTCGFVLGSVSRKLQAGVNGILFCLTLLSAPLYDAYLRHILRLRFGPQPRPDVHVPPFHGPVFALTFYHSVFSVIVQAVLVALPALWGLREAAKVRDLRPAFRTVIGIGALITVALIVIQSPGLVFFLWTYVRGGPWHGWQIQLPRFIAYWPVVYLVATAAARRWHARVAPA